MRLVTQSFLVLALLISAPLLAQESADETGDETAVEADREQLLSLRETLVEAIIANDIDKQIQFVEPEVVTTWQNNQVASGHDGLRAFMEEMSAEKEDVFQGYTERPSSDAVRIVRGVDVAIAHGKSIPHYKFLGLDFDLENRWTATLLKQDGQWKIAAYHVSGDITDNPLLNAAKNSLYWSAGVALLIGLVLGVVVTKLLGKTRSSAP